MSQVGNYAVWIGVHVFCWKEQFEEFKDGTGHEEPSGPLCPPDHAVWWFVAPPEVWKVRMFIWRISLLCAAALSEDGKERQNLCLPLALLLVFHQTLGFPWSYSFILLLYNLGVI